VLDVRDGKALLLSEKVMGSMSYHGKNENTTWAKCDLRAYLNGAFYTSFSAADKKKIAETLNENKDNQWFGTTGGVDTKDKVFLLSLEEVVEYFGDSGQLTGGNRESNYMISDEYNKARVARGDDGWSSHWWLRSPGRNSRSATHVFGGGSIDISGISVDADFSESLYEIGIRPALWVYLDNDASQTQTATPPPPQTSATDTPTDSTPTDSTPPQTSATDTPPDASPPAQEGSAKVGDIMEFGGYSWRVIAVQGDNALIITEEVIDLRAYNEEREDVTWADCDLRAWLNGEFLDSFDEGERDLIVETRNGNNDNEWFGSDGGEDTTDSVFLLSLEEAVRYFGDSGQLAKRPSDTSRFISDGHNDNRVAFSDDSATWWWLRSPGKAGTAATDVISDGSINVEGSGVHNHGGVRPALWLKP
jgi:hypothetical protein